eukprot:TRINITY_DN3197_c1_g1_i1.p1 TRINITY_DN3197_c1_g1~~TRINITY_DN3197_c1_g1_i1.p1  ORF type:complete len:234 (+),score=8.60 TRINITY_DN3197_c1_g1_i1:124-825(+)
MNESVVKAVYDGLNFLIVMSGVLYFIPFLLLYYPYYVALIFSLVNFIICLFKKLGKIQNNRFYYQKFFFDENFQYSITIILFLFISPKSFFVLSLIIYALLPLSYAIYAYTKTPIQLKELIQTKIVDNNGTILIFIASYSEIMVIFELVFGLFQGIIHVIPLFLYYQFLKYKYVKSYHTRLVFQAIREKLDPIFYSQHSPEMIKMVYTKIKTELYNRAMSIVEIVPQNNEQNQ